MNLIKLFIFMLFSFCFQQKQDEKLNKVIITKFLEQAGGFDKISSLKDFTIKSTVEIVGSKNDMISYFKFPNKYLTICSYRGVEKFRMLIVGNSMVIVFKNRVSMQTSALVAKTNLMRFNIFHEASITKQKIYSKALDLTGIVSPGSMTSKAVLPINFIKDDMAWTNFYDIDTKSKIASVWGITTRIDEPEKVEICFEEYLEYKNFDGLKFPLKIRTHLNQKYFSTTEIKTVEINQNISDKIFQIER